MSKEGTKYSQKRERLGLSFASRNQFQLKAYELILQNSEDYGGATNYITEAVLAFNKVTKKAASPTTGTENAKDTVSSDEIKELLIAIMKKIDTAPSIQTVIDVPSASCPQTIPMQTEAVESPIIDKAALKRSIEPLIAIYDAPQDSDRPVPSDDAQRRMIENLAAFGGYE